MLINLISISFAQEIGEHLAHLEISREEKGIECLFTEPFITFRYHFEDQLLTQNGMDIPLGIYKSSLSRKETQNPFSAEYHLKTPDSSVFSLVLNNAGSDGMSDRRYPISATYNSLHGGCFFIEEFGTHIVQGVHSESEPWLNLRTQPSTKGTMIGKLREGTELTVLETTNGWSKIRVVTSNLKAQEGWVSSKYIQKRELK